MPGWETHSAPYITYEIATALAFLYFREANARHAVIEVGLGGRLDATNVVEPLVSVITSISYDHMQVLGNTLAEIARRKSRNHQARCTGRHLGARARRRWP